LIDLEDHQTKLIEIPALRRTLGDFNQKQLSVIEETCAPISGIWLESSFEGNPLASLKLFSSDTALVNEFITTLFAFIENEKKRDEVNSQSIVSFDVIDPYPHQEWIKSNDKLLTKVDWKNISSWFQLFSPIEQLKGSEIIKYLEELKKRLCILDLNKHDQKLSSKLIDIPLSTIEEWLFLAKKATALNPLCFIQHDSLQKQLEELKQCLSNLEINKHDQKFSIKLIDLPISTLEEWLSLSRKVTVFNPICFTQNDSLQKELQSLKQRLSSLELQDQDKTLSSKLVDIPMSTLEEWLSLAQKVITSDSFSSLLNPLHLIRLYRIKSVLSNLNEKTTLESIKLFQNLAEFEKQQRPIREAVLLLLEKTYQGNEASKPIFPKDLDISIDSMMEDLLCIVEIQKIVLGIGEDLTFERAIQFQSASELEIQIRPIRENVLKLSERLYQETTQLGLLCLEDLRILVKRMLEDLASIVQLKHVLNDLGADQAFERARQFKNAADLEREQRPLRIEISKLLEALYQENEILKPIFLKDLLSVTDRMIGDLLLAQNGIFALLTCPRQEGIESIVKTGLPAYLEFISRYREAFSRHRARFFSLGTLDRLYPFFCEDLFKLCQDNIRNNNSNLAELRPMVESLPSLSSYQEFRLQASDLSTEVLKVFAILREKEKQLREYPLEELEGIIRRLIAREARLSWKDRIEQKFPILRLAQKELSRKIQILDESSAKMRKLNQRFLSFNMDVEKIESPKDWEDLTRLRGPRSRRLREIIERGWDLGLTQLRPVWLMNPDTASQLFPLKAGMFDVIIFDEASQIPIENALPTLYRGKRTIISGDEKQMPPTNVFRKRLDDDEEYGSDDEDLDERVSEADRIELEDTWNRREIKDCVDLLSLGKMVLPRSMLQIHYRSKYRELIAFSNAAFYGNRLSVPVRHPESVIQNIRPIEVVRVDGIYANQTNRGEAEKVIDLLAERWSSPNRPSIGVVTFNSKQVDLIEDILAERAENDPAFRQALSNERDRQQGGEDMGFFVKNVENVQGDERDMIIFSSTFGRDESGSFRRQFGLLSQTGGERRLNVAITRAREKVILVTSLPINEISEALAKRECPKNPRDYLQAYFDYATKISDGSLETARRSLDIMTSETPSSQMSSNFEKDGFVRSVAAFIKSLGLKPSAIKENDAFGLDFVIEDPEKKLFGIGIECDAHSHPILENARAREVWRPKVLRKEIPHVHRVTSYAWYHRRREEEERLKQVLEGALGIMLTGASIKVSSGGRE